jgi:hypothetical protein
MIIAITGGRDEHLSPSSGAAFVEWCRRIGVRTVRHGKCKTGIDHDLADLLAGVGFLFADPWPALWNEYGKPAGPRRNRRMLSGDRSDWGRWSEPPAVRLVAWPGGSGTQTCRDHADSLLIPIIEAATIERWHASILASASRPRRSVESA